MAKSAIDRNSIAVTRGKTSDDTARFRPDATEIDVDAVPHMVWSARPDGHHEYHNRRWYEFTGISPNSVEGGAWINLVHPDDQAAVLAAWQVALDARSE